MRAAVTTEAGGFEVVDLADPRPGPDELVVAVGGCGVCGSDLKAQPFMPAGTTMGHEFGGRVVAVGTSAADAGWREGAVVAVLPVVSCGSCGWCRAGLVAHCATTRFIGMGTDGGGFAELAVVPAAHAFALPADVPTVHAPLVEPFAVGLHAVHTAEVEPGDDVLVVGAGGVGLTAFAWAHALGASRVTAVDPDPARRAAARALGADDDVASLGEADEKGYDVVVECVGHPELIAAAATAARARGRITIAGACDQPVTLEPIGALLGELSFRWSVAYRPDEFREVVEAFAQGVVDPSAVIGTTVALDDVGGALELVRSGATTGRVVVIPDL